MTEVDNDGVIYRDGYSELYSVPGSLTVVYVDTKTTRIYSVSKDDNAFINCRSRLKEVIFPQYSAL